jgi:uncharacterized protein YbgA (DUF1722 family)
MTKKDMIQQLEEYERLGMLVSRFSEVMRARLYEKVQEGYEGWADHTDPHVVETVQEKLFASVEKYRRGEKKQLVDIANLAAILWLHQIVRSRH